MTFTTITFLVFYALFFMAWWLVAAKNKVLRNVFILVASYIFYGWWDWRFLTLIFFSSLVDFTAGWYIGNTASPVKKKILMAISLITNLGLLGFFKYFNFFITSFIDLSTSLGYNPDVHTLKIILPVGISFYTFQTLSYTLDIYHGRLKPTSKIIDFFAFVSFFPQLVAGPIERASHLLPQFTRTVSFDYARTVEGLRLMLWGFFKKLVIADSLGKIVNLYFENPGGYDPLSAWIAILAFTFQIYCDFSGYSDIAIGCARTLGFDLMTNFQTPYFSRSFSDFWRRWHISLSSWFRDYVYIPLGGNQHGTTRYAFNIMITFLLSGLWHGANYTFLIWGGMHGLFLVLERLVWKKQKPAWIWTGVVFVLTLLLWVPFRAENVQQMWTVYASLLGHAGSLHIAPLTPYYATLAILFLAFVAWERYMNTTPFHLKIQSVKRPGRLIVYYTLLFLIFLYGDFNNAPSFIYFQF